MITTFIHQCGNPGRERFVIVLCSSWNNRHHFLLFLELLGSNGGKTVVEICLVLKWCCMWILYLGRKGVPCSELTKLCISRASGRWTLLFFRETQSAARTSYIRPRKSNWFQFEIIKYSMNLAKLQNWLQCDSYSMRNLIHIQSTWGHTEPVRLRLDVCRLASFLKSSLAFSSCCSSETERCHSCLSFCSASAHWRFASSSLRHKRWQTAVHMKNPLPLLSPYARVSQTGWGNCVIIKIWLIAIIKSNPVI